MLMDLKKLGQMLQQKRETLGLPATTVAKRAGIGRTTLWKVERGEDSRTGQPSRLSKDKLERLLEVLGMSQREKVHLLQLAGYIDDTIQPEGSASPSEGIFSDAFFFPDDEDSELWILQDELKFVLENPSITKEQRSEIVDLCHSFIGWLKFRYQLVDGS